MNIKIKKIKELVESLNQKDKIIILNVIYASLSNPTNFKTIKNIDAFAFNCPNVYDYRDDKYISEKDFKKIKSKNSF